MGRITQNLESNVRSELNEIFDQSLKQIDEQYLKRMDDYQASLISQKTDDCLARIRAKVKPNSKK